MSRSKNAATYPEAFHDLVREAAIRIVHIPCEDPVEAKRLMGRLYSFFGALEKAIQRPDAPEVVRELRRLSVKVQLRVEGNILIARPQDLDPMAKKILEALGQTQHPTIADQMKPSAALLDSLKKEDTNE